MDVKANLAKVCAEGFGVTLLFLAPFRCPRAGSTIVPLPLRERGANGSAGSCVAWGSSLRLQTPTDTRLVAPRVCSRQR